MAAHRKSDSFLKPDYAWLTVKRAVERNRNITIPEKFSAFLSRVALKKSASSLNRSRSGIMKPKLRHELSSPRGSPNSLIAKQAMNGCIQA
jgi:hypothetical protein